MSCYDRLGLALEDRLLILGLRYRNHFYPPIIFTGARQMAINCQNRRCRSNTSGPYGSHHIRGDPSLTGLITVFQSNASIVSDPDTERSNAISWAFLIDISDTTELGRRQWECVRTVTRI